MERLKGNFSRSVQNFSRTPLKNMVFNKPSYSQKPLFSQQSQQDLTASRIRLFKRFMIWFLLIIILSLYGLNIFKYLAEGTDIITALLAPFTYTLTLISGTTLNTTIQNISQGGQVVITQISEFLSAIITFVTNILTGSLKAAENTSSSAISQLQSNITKDKINSGDINRTNQGTETEEAEGTETTILQNERKVNERTRDVPKEVKNTIKEKENTEPAPLQSNSNEYGYCYIGKTNNARNCAKVSSRNKCMSGDIFPTMEICINPNLRS
jgi:hypothetical protein